MAHAPVAEGGDAMSAAIDRYARIAVEVGLNVRHGQTVEVTAPLEAAPFVRTVAEHAYAAGARHVYVDWADEQLSRITYLRAPEEAFTEYPRWRAAGMEEMAEDGAAFLSVYGPDPELLRDVDPARVATANRTRQQALAGYYRHVSEMRTPWCVIGVPTPGWARKVFPDADGPVAVRRLWEHILSAARADLDDPVGAWRTHLAELAARTRWLNAARFDALRFRGPGTELTVGLPAGHVWLSGTSTDRRGTEFVPNMPTEEVFTAPSRSRVDGEVSSTMPLNYSGVLIQGLRLSLRAGRVVEATASAGQEALQGLLDMDDGARRLGEIALVPHGSAVSRLRTLFYNTLFDENAASHLALGRCYPVCLEDGGGLDADGLAKRDANYSLAHVDFMVGSEAMDVDGLDAHGAATPVMRSGKWAWGAPRSAPGPRGLANAASPIDVEAPA